MKTLQYFLIIFTTCFFIACNNDTDPTDDGTDVIENPDDDQTNDDDDNSDETAMYFPPTDSDTWETADLTALNWNEDKLEALYTSLEENDTRAFIILKDGKIAVEKYFGLNGLETENFNKDSNWYWASAGKTIISFAIGLAQQQNYLDINNKTSEYLGVGWTNLNQEKEDLITVKHQLSMTTGLDYDVSNENCTEPICLNYSADAGDEWYYYNAPYILLRDVISGATNQDYKTYIEENIEDKIGMSSAFWFGIDDLTLYWSNARDMARFGLLVLNKGTWDDTEILTDSNYFEEMTTTSQDLNDAYGYLWWLNGKDSVIYPATTFVLNQELASNAPDDMIAAIGKNGQFIDVVPSENMVVIRMGEAPSDALVPILFHNEMWALINDVIN